MWFVISACSLRERDDHTAGNTNKDYHFNENKRWADNEGRTRYPCVMCNLRVEEEESLHGTDDVLYQRTLNLLRRVR
jgi:hypothetical protein